MNFEILSHQGPPDPLCLDLPICLSGDPLKENSTDCPSLHLVKTALLQGPPNEEVETEGSASVEISGQGKETLSLHNAIFCFLNNTPFPW